MFVIVLFQAITGLDNSQATAESLKEAKTKMLDNSMVKTLSTLIQLDTKVSSLHDEIELTKKNVEVKMEIAGSNLERHITENNKNMHILYERLNTKEEQMVTRDDNIVKHMEQIESLETKSESFDKTLHEVQKDVDSIKATTGICFSIHFLKITQLQWVLWKYQDISYYCLINANCIFYPKKIFNKKNNIMLMHILINIQNRTCYKMYNI